MKNSLLRFPVAGALLLLCVLPVMSSCAQRVAGQAVSRVESGAAMRPAAWADGVFTAGDGRRYATREWGKWEGDAPRVVIIGVHGLGGESVDYENLGKYLMKHSAGVALVSYNLRGQGREAQAKDRGDVDNSRQWTQDLGDLTALVGKRWPTATLVYMGESLGSMVAAHACVAVVEQTKPGETPIPLPDRQPGIGAGVAWMQGVGMREFPVKGVILSSPITGYGNKLSAGKRAAFKMLALALPKSRFDLQEIGGMRNQPVNIVDGVNFQEQAAATPWHVRNYTLRALSQIDRMIMGMNRCATRMTLPVLVLHGGQDILCDARTVERFYAQLPPNPANSRKLYAKGHHLLMYDADNQTVFRDVADWIKANFPEPPKPTALRSHPD